MPANVVSIDNAKKHMTNAEKKLRKNAEKQFQRDKVKLKKPAYVKADAIANKYWTATLKRMDGISLLDDVDAEMLGRYCCIAARLERLNADPEPPFDEKVLKRVEAAERNMISYAEKLGLTPAGRARLAKKRAEERIIDPDAELYGDEGQGE